MIIIIMIIINHQIGRLVFEIAAVKIGIIDGLSLVRCLFQHVKYRNKHIRLMI